MRMRMRMLALLVMMRWRPLGDLPFVIRDKKGKLFWDESSLVFRGRISIWYFCLGECLYILRDVVRFLCTFLFFLFSYIILLYTGLVTIYLWHTLYFFHIYMMMYVVFHLSLHVFFLFTLYTHVFLCMQSLILFHTIMPWWVLFKVF